MSSQLRVGKALLEGRDNVMQRQRQPFRQLNHLRLPPRQWRPLRWHEKAG